MQTVQDIEGDPSSSPSGLAGRGILVFSHLRWRFVWQRPQQFLSRFAERHPVLFFEEPIFDLPAGAAPEKVIEEVQPNIRTLALRAAPGVPDEALDHARLKAIEETVAEAGWAEAFREPILWYYNPMDFRWSSGHLGSGRVVYDCMDELSLFHGAPPALADQEAALMKEADVVFTGGLSLYERKSQQHRNTHFFGCGVDYRHFAQAQEQGPLPPEIIGLSKPVVGWFGVIDERMDTGLLSEAATLRPDWYFVLVGPVVKIDAASLPQQNNIIWVGQRDYSELPAYCRGFDVCMMPFALNDATRFINPTKALEYLATGRPVVSTPVQDVISQYSGLIYIAGSAEEFVAAIESALDENRERVLQGIERAKAASWEATVAQMDALIAQAR